MLKLFKKSNKQDTKRKLNPPGKPKVHRGSRSTALLVWSKPADMSKKIQIVCYEIWASDDSGISWNEIKAVTGDHVSTDVDVQPNVPYKFKIVANCGEFGATPTSLESDEFILVQKDVTRPNVQQHNPTQPLSYSKNMVTTEVQSPSGNNGIRTQQTTLMFQAEDACLTDSDDSNGSPPLTNNYTGNVAKLQQHYPIQSQSYLENTVTAREQSPSGNNNIGMRQNTLMSPDVDACSTDASKKVNVVHPSTDHSNQPKPQIKEKPSPSSRIIAMSSIFNAGPTCIYQINPVITEKNIVDNIQKCEVGPKCSKHEKVIMVVGMTGSGKTTLINGLCNYYYGIKWEDPFRLKLIVENEKNKNISQAESQTSWITSYTLYHIEGCNFPYTLTIIDTPGFGDTSGIQRDKLITERVRKFFKSGGRTGIDQIHAVGFVVQSSLARLTGSQRYIFDSILSLFGKDIENNIFMFLTFADGKKPQVLDSLLKAGLPSKNYFKFNNSALYAEKDDSEGGLNFDEMFWKMGHESFRLFLQALGQVQVQSLVLTKDVLDERAELEATVIGIQIDIQTGLNKLEQLREEKQFLKVHQADIDKNKNFTYTVHEETVQMEPILDGTFTTNCIKCKRTCHHPCILTDDDKAGCAAMHKEGEKKGYCLICPGNCYWKIHKNLPYTFVIERVPVLKTSEDLMQRYQEAQGKHLSAKEVIKKITTEFEAIKVKVYCLTNKVRGSLARLQEIALKPNPLSTTDYIDMLIESEKAEGRTGFQQRIKQLNEVRKQAEYMKQMADRGFDPFKEYKEKVLEEQNAKKPGVWAKIGKYLPWN